MANTEFPTNTKRVDPYQGWRFLVLFGKSTTPVAGVSKVGGLSRTTEVVKHRSGGDPSTPRVIPGQSSYEPITLERGVTHDVAFEQWANKVWYYPNSLKAPANQVVSLKDFRKDITIELYNEAGQKVIAYNVYRCWVSEYHALPELDSGGSSIAIQSIKLENEGWERDVAVKAPAEPSFTQPSS